MAQGTIKVTIKNGLIQRQYADQKWVDPHWYKKETMGKTHGEKTKDLLRSGGRNNSIMVSREGSETDST